MKFDEYTALGNDNLTRFFSDLSTECSVRRMNEFEPHRIRPNLMNPADYYYTYGEKMPIEPNMLETVVSLIERLGVSIAVVFASFYYILFLTKQAKEERQAFWKKGCRKR